MYYNILFQLCKYTEGVIAELSEKGVNDNAVAKFNTILNLLSVTVDNIAEIAGEKRTENLCRIIRDAEALSGDRYKVEFDLSLVRGQGYYTGTVFEIRSDKFNGAVAGGGRFDKLIGKFIGENVSACGFSIGFERIFEILSEMEKSGFIKEKKAFIYDNNFTEAYGKAEAMRDKFDVSLFRRPKKMKAFLDKLAVSGFSGFISEDNMSVKSFE